LDHFMPVKEVAQDRGLHRAGAQYEMIVAVVPSESPVGDVLRRLPSRGKRFAASSTMR